MEDIQLINVSKRYAGNLEAALKKLTLHIKKGEIVTLLGPSGCGKTTTLRLIAGFEKPDNGRILLRGTEVCSDQGKWIPPERRGVGMVFQDYALFPHLSVAENVAFGIRNEVFKKERTKNILELVGLGGYEKRLPHELSGGQQQRVALARALAPSPVVILLDEPFSNLDTELRKHMRQEIRKILKAEGTTAIFVTHDQKEAFELSDKILVMQNGIVEQEGIPQEIYLRPNNEFVARFIGKSNIIEGIVNNEKLIETELGKINVETVGISRGFTVKILIRPHDLIIDPEGYIRGKLKDVTFKGESVEGIVELDTRGNSKKDLLVYFHPSETFKSGDEITLKIIPNRAVIIN